ncbi:MAG: hypothetical protein GDA53_03315 [Rhodobacteraceae bacterium]|nr:hypothetical protein [Paracoccaceae bacterium]
MAENWHWIYRVIGALALCRIGVFGWALTLPKDASAHRTRVINDLAQAFAKTN